MSGHVIVAGAGVAGLNAAVRLAGRGHRVTLVEKRKWAGGRVYSRRDDQTGLALDNGQHILTSGYHHFLEYLGLIGSTDGHHIPSRMQVMLRDLEHGPYWVRAPRLPAWAAPVGPVGAMLGFRHLALGIRARMLSSLAKMTVAIARGIPARLDTITADRWLDELGVPGEMRRGLWDLFTVSFVNEPATRASAFVLAQQLKWGLDNPTMSLGYPTTDLSSWAIEPGVRFVERHGGEVRYGTPIAGIELHPDGRVRALTTRDGEELTADAYVLALPPTPMGKLVQSSPLKAHSFFTRIPRIETAPITGVDVWLDEPLPTFYSFEGLLGTTIEWVFDRSKMCGTTTTHGHYYTLIVSGSWGLTTKTAAQIVELAMADLRRHFPAARRSKLLRSRIIREPDATFSAVPGFQARRCSQKTPIANLFLAGDWTATNLPATMESAAKSGALAAEQAAAALN